MKYIDRTLSSKLKSAAKSFSAISLSGPRQSGKTTLLRTVFADTHKYVSLDVPDVRDMAINDPRGFLKMYPAPLIIDEAQYAPKLFHYLREAIDNNRVQRGMYIITGSQNLLLNQKIAETLAGRTAVLELLPLSNRERIGNPDSDYFWQSENLFSRPASNNDDIWNNLYSGFYPELWSGINDDVDLWMRSYVRTYLERDVRILRNLSDLTAFRNFLQLVATRCGCLLNYQDLSRDLGVSLNTVKGWISVLEASFQVLILHPYYVNIGKQLTKTPKIYMIDSGLLCNLLGIASGDDLMHSPYAGQVFENAVIIDIYKSLLHKGQRANLSFWRTTAGTEVDLLINSGTQFYAVEIKKTSTPQLKHYNSMKQLKKDLGDRIIKSYLVHAGDHILPGSDIISLPFNLL